MASSSAQHLDGKSRPAWQQLLTSPTLVLVAATLVVTGLFFGEVLFKDQAYYPGDVSRLYLPLQTAFRDALASGRLPWWNSSIGAGYPLLAEGEVAALYPLSWLAVSASTAVRGLSLLVVLHYLLAGWGWYLFGRSLGASRLAAYAGALVACLGGYSIAHLSHVAIVATTAWLPWLLFLTQRVTTEAGPRRRLPAALALALASALYLLAGHIQTALLGLAMVICFGIVRLWPHPGTTHLGHRVGLWLAALALGAVLAAPQLLVSAELTLVSQRAGGLSEDYFTSYSFHPYLLATYISPYALGNPFPEGSVEVMGYVGLLPLLLSLLAIIKSTSRSKWFFLAFALSGLFMATGRWNPLYGYLVRLPVLNLFRAPSRYLYWTGVGVAVLTMLGLDWIRSEIGQTRQQSPRVFAPIIAPVVMGTVALIAGGMGVDVLVAAWGWLPLVVAAGVLALVWAARRTDWALWASMACALIVVDLYAYGAVLDGTFNATWPLERIQATPASLDFLETDSTLYRIYTKEEIMPALSVQRESYYPNMALTSGIQSANIYAPLVPSAYEEYLAQMTAPDLDRLNVKYYLIPQLLPVDEPSELYDVENPMTAYPTGQWLPIAPETVARVEIDSYLSHSADVPDGTLVAEIQFRDNAGTLTSIPLRAGMETSEWAYERHDVAEQVAHSMARVASTFPARSGYPPSDHPGHTYRAAYTLAQPSTIVAVRFVLYRPEAFVRIERVGLYDPDDSGTELDHLLGLGNHSIAYRSEDVLVYENQDAWPRVYTVTQDQATRDGDALSLAPSLTASALGPADVLSYDETEVRLQATLSGPGYLVLADLAYPGWRAKVDGQPAAILTCDGIYRALSLDAGTHTVTFTYAPLDGILPRLYALLAGR